MDSAAVLGKYVPRDTLIHRLDPRVKLFLSILLMVAIFVPYGSYTSCLFVYGLILLFLIICLLISRISPIRVLTNIKPLWFTLVFLLIVNIFIPNQAFSYVIADWGGFKIYLESILQSSKILLRILLMIIDTLILTSTTKSTDLSYSFEWFLSPLKLFKIPVGILAMIVSLTLRFIPTILEETLRIKKAQESRGIDFKHGKISKRIKAIFSLLIPLLIVSFSRAAELADALEARGYVPTEKRTRYQKLHFGINDAIAIILICAMCAGFFALSHFKFDLIAVLFNVVNPITSLGV